MIEETGITPNIGKLLFIQQFTDTNAASRHGINEQLELFFHITNWQDYQNINLEKTSHGVEEVAECGFVDPKTTHILPDYLQQVDLAWLIDTATETQILSEL